MPTADVEHSDLTGADAIHPMMFIQSADPGAVGANKCWLDTTGGPALHNGAILKSRNSGNSGWDVRFNASLLP